MVKLEELTHLDLKLIIQKKKMMDQVPETKELLSYIDVLIDGPFIEEGKNLKIRFRGSDNQRIIDVKKTMEAGEIVLWEEK